MQTPEKPDSIGQIKTESLFGGMYLLIELPGSFSDEQREKLISEISRNLSPSAPPLSQADLKGHKNVALDDQYTIGINLDGSIRVINGANPLTNEEYREMKDAVNVAIKSLEEEKASQTIGSSEKFGYITTDESSPITIDQLNALKQKPEYLNCYVNSVDFSQLADGSLVEIYCSGHRSAHYIVRKNGDRVSIWHSLSSGPMECSVEEFNKSTVFREGEKPYNVVGLSVGNIKGFPYFSYDIKDGKFSTRPLESSGDFWVDEIHSLIILKI